MCKHHLSLPRALPAHTFPKGTFKCPEDPGGQQSTVTCLLVVTSPNRNQSAAPSQGAKGPSHRPVHSPHMAKCNLPPTRDQTKQNFFSGFLAATQRLSSKPPSATPRAPRHPHVAPERLGNKRLPATCALSASVGPATSLGLKVAHDLPLLSYEVDSREKPSFEYTSVGTSQEHDSPEGWAVLAGGVLDRRARAQE